MSKRTPLIGILDDEEAFRRALTRLLSTHEFEIVSFADGADLIAETRRRRFDCLLLDLYMPGLSGLDVLAELRWNSDPPPAIVITGHDDPDLVKRALALNAFECQRKPITEATLLRAIDRALDRPEKAANDPGD
jgi:two-component system CheB/CheR fusion protein